MIELYIQEGIIRVASARAIIYRQVLVSIENKKAWCPDGKINHQDTKPDT